MFDKAKCDEGIRRTCALFDELGLTMAERWWVLLCLKAGAEKAMAEGFAGVAARFDAMAEDYAKADVDTMKGT